MLPSMYLSLHSIQFFYTLCNLFASILRLIEQQGLLENIVAFIVGYHLSRFVMICDLELYFEQ